MGNLPTIFVPIEVLLSVAEEATLVSSVEIETPCESVTETEPALEFSSKVEPIVLSSINEESLMPIIEAESDIISPTEPACMKKTQVESDVSSAEQVLMPAIEIKSHIISHVMKNQFLCRQ